MAVTINSYHGGPSFRQRLSTIAQYSVAVLNDMLDSIRKVVFPSLILSTLANTFSTSFSFESSAMDAHVKPRQGWLDDFWQGPTKNVLTEYNRFSINCDAKENMLAFS